MKIAVFTNNYKPIISGVTESIESFREGLEKRGHEVFIFAPHFPGYKDENPSVFRFRSVDFRYKTAFPIAITRSWLIYRKLKKLNVDIIHSQHPFNVGKAALRYAQRLNIPIVFTNHTRYDLYTHFIPFFPQKFLKWYVRRESIDYANKCDVVISPTQSIKEMLIDWGMMVKIEVIPTSIRPEQFERSNDSEIRRRELRSRFGVKDDEVLLLTASRLAKEKSVDFLVKVFAQLKALRSTQMGTPSQMAGRQINADIKFMIVGNGSAKAELEEMAKNLSIQSNIIFTGAIQHSEIADYFHAGDIFMYASISETQGIMIAEAMASGLPIVAVKAPGAMDTIESGVDGILSPNIEEAFAQRVKSLIEDDDLRKKISEKAVLKAREYSVDVCVEKMIEVYLSLQEKREVFYSPPFEKGGRGDARVQ